MSESISTGVRCRGIVNKGHGVKESDRCKMIIYTGERYNLCQNKNKDMCSMHCDCEYCSNKYAKTKNRGIRYSGEMKETSNDFFWKEDDIVKLQCLLQAISEKHSLKPFIKKTKEIYLKRNKMKNLQDKLSVLEVEMKRLRREINEI